MTTRQSQPTRQSLVTPKSLPRFTDADTKGTTRNIRTDVLQTASPERRSALRADYAYRFPRSNFRPHAENAVRSESGATMASKATAMA